MVAERGAFEEIIPRPARPPHLISEKRPQDTLEALLLPAFGRSDSQRIQPRCVAFEQFHPIMNRGDCPIEAIAISV